MNLRYASMAIVMVCQCVSISAAMAQGAPAPIGYWTTDQDVERFLIQANGSCSFQAVGPPATTFFGTCSWNPSSRGGILTMMNQTTYYPAPIYYNVVWIDQQTISIDGDVFHRRQ